MSHIAKNTFYVIKLIITYFEMSKLCFIFYITITQITDDGTTTPRRLSVQKVHIHAYIHTYHAQIESPETERILQFISENDYYSNIKIILSLFFKKFNIEHTNFKFILDVLF